MALIAHWDDERIVGRAGKDYLYHGDILCQVWDHGRKIRVDGAVYSFVRCWAMRMTWES